MIKIHFINVGHGDCIVIEFCDKSRIAVVDINMSKEMDNDSQSEVLNELNSYDKNHYQSLNFSNSQIFEKAGYNINLTNPIDYIKQLTNGSIFRFISTHPHLDHLSGLSELKSRVGILNYWVVNNKLLVNSSNLSNSQNEDWTLYKKLRDTTERIQDGITIVKPKEGSKNQYWIEDNITILSPNNKLVKLAEETNRPNIMSYVLLINYAGHKIILGGDAEDETWEYIYKNHSDLIKDVTILKASHHGRNSGYYQSAIELMKPKYTIVSVGKKPDTDASNKYRNYCENVLSTRWMGNIVFEIHSKGEIKYYCEHNR
ncbi:MAG: hydrolase (metallo-beta-lactamase superfamily) [Bacteroidetes bacterium]|nr:hydrolase (metallo-beta-lactamase superfamily) [Bacteroidota bacterium]